MQVSQLTISHIVCFVGATLDSIRVGAQTVENTAFILGSLVIDRTFTGAYFERGETPQE